MDGGPAGARLWTSPSGKGCRIFSRPKVVSGLRRISRLSTPYLFLFPALLGLFLFKIYPIVIAFMESLQTYNFVRRVKEFTGLGNYLALFEDPVFWNSFEVTFWFNLLINPFQIVMAFLLACLLNAKLRTIALFRAVNFIPVCVSVPTACILWDIMLNPQQGIVNSILASFNLSPQPFLTDSSQALETVIGIASWRGIGYWALFFLAGLQEVPVAPYEAAAIDGANRWQRFIRITIPMMKRPLTFVTVSVTVANMFLFAPMYILTNGGPQQSTNVLMLESYNSAFLYSDMGRASAIVILLLLVTLVVIGIQFRMLRAQH